MVADSVLLHGWQPGWLEAVILAGVLQLLLLLKTLADGRSLLRQHAAMAGLCLLAGIVSLGLPSLGLARAAALFDAAAIVIMGMLLIRLSGLALFRLLLPKLGFVPPRILEDVLLMLAYVTWGMVRLRYAGLDLGSLVTTSAVITGIVAFSMQETLGNILGGLVLQIDNSVQIGDWIKVDDVRGKVVEVHWRHTAVLTNNGEVVVIPNSLLMKSKFTVFSSAAQQDFRRWVYFPLNYPVPPQTVIPVIEKAIREADIAYMAHEPAPECVVMDYKDGSTIYALRYWLTNPLHDDSTDSVVRVHIFTALQRQGFHLARPCLDALITQQDAAHNALMQEQAVRERSQALRSVNLFGTLSDEERLQLAASLRDTPFSKGDVMTHQGAVAHWLYLLVEGEADVWLELGGGQRRHLATLMPGKVFGEMGLLTGEPRRATVTAKTDALCYRLDKQSLESVLQARPELAEELAHILAERNQQLVAVAEQAGQPGVHEQRATILAGIKRFFGLTG